MESGKNIALIGGRAVGKSTIARQLAERLKRELFVTDELIVQKAGKSIPEIVRDIGWRGFRELEYEVVLTISQMSDVIIDCGGGVVCEQNENNEQSFSDRKVQILENGIVIWLDCPVEEQLHRLGVDPNRPSLIVGKSSIEEVEEIMNLRRPWYERAADCKINTAKNTAEQVVGQIMQLVEEKHLMR